MDFAQAAQICGLGCKSMKGNVLTKKYGPFVRLAFIITDAPLEVDAPFTEELCDNCGLCITACPGHAIRTGGLDSWQCSVYYRGAHKTNPYITSEFLRDNAEREAILNGEKRFDAESARQIYHELDFLPSHATGYAPCICGKACDIVCYKHIMGVKEL